MGCVVPQTQFEPTLKVWNSPKNKPQNTRTKQHTVWVWVVKMKAKQTTRT